MSGRVAVGNGVGPSLAKAEGSGAGVGLSQVKSILFI